VAVDFAAVLAFGLWHGRRQKTTDDYFLASRSIPGWVVAFSLVATLIGSTTFVGHPGGVFADDMWYLPFLAALPFVMIFVARVIVPLYRHKIRMSVYEYLERRFGYPARAYGGGAFIVSRIVDVSSTLYFLGIAVALVTGFDAWWVILLVGLFTLAYTVIGGVGAVAWTDVMQGLLLVGGGLMCILIALFRPEAGPGAVIGAAWEAGKFGTGDWTFGLTELNAWILLLGGAIWTLQRYAADQHLVQRYLVARSDEEAAWATYVGAVAGVPIWLGFLFLGALLYGFYAVSPTPLPAEVQAVQDNVVPYFIRTQAPPGVLGAIVAALAAAAMSSLAADMNSIATVFVDDFYRKLRPDSSDRRQLDVGRGVVVVMGVAAVLLAQQWLGLGSAIEFVVQLLSIATAGLLGLFALGLVTTRATAAGAWTGIGACIVFTAWATLTSVELPTLDRTLLDLGPMNFPWDPFLIGILNHVVLFVVAFGTSYLVGRERDLTGLTVWTQEG
jgi:SSS family solute:Na+ symporter